MPERRAAIGRRDRPRKAARRGERLHISARKFVRRYASRPSMPLSDPWELGPICGNAYAEFAYFKLSHYPCARSETFGSRHRRAVCLANASLDASAGKTPTTSIPALAGGLDESLPRKFGRLLPLQDRDAGFAGLPVARTPFRRPAAEKTLGRRSGRRDIDPFVAPAQFHTDIALPTLRVQIARQELPSVHQRS